MYRKIYGDKSGLETQEATSLGLLPSAWAQLAHKAVSLLQLTKQSLYVVLAFLSYSPQPKENQSYTGPGKVCGVLAPYSGGVS